VGNGYAVKMIDVTEKEYRHSSEKESICPGCLLHSM